MNKFVLGFRWAVVLGILQDWFFALPGMLIPNAVLGVGGAAPALQPVWVAYACVLLTVLSIASIPAAVDALRNWPFAVLSVLARIGGATFFYVLYPGQFPALFGMLALSFAILQGTLLALAVVSTEPAPERGAGTQPATWWPFLLRAFSALVLLGGAAGVGTWHLLFREVPQSFDAIEEAFKYGSIGTENDNGLPYWIWVVLPRVFPEYLPGPGGYTSLGIVWEPGKETPVGFSKKTIGFSRIGISCALCHSGTYRLNAADTPVVAPTAPATRFDALAYQRFLFACASDPRFNADVLLGGIYYEVKLSWAEQQLYRHVLIPRTRAALLQEKERYAWTRTRPTWGPGRIDPFNPVKYRILDISPEEDKTIGNSDMQPLWDRRSRAGHALHWDGLNTSLTEVVLSGAIGDGASPKSLPVGPLKALEEYLLNAKPPKYPLSIAKAEAEKGKGIFDQWCAQCHAVGGERTGKVIPWAEVRTDRNRIEMWSQKAADNYNAYAKDYAWSFARFVKQDGYLAVPLDGLWLRGPYLHNGSVPTLADLLEPAAKRPAVFYRGYDVLDRSRVGFVSGEEARQAGAFRFDTAVPGNGREGHEGKEYGTELSAEQKRALIEHLKTL